MRNSSLDPVDISKWRWSLFLDDAISFLSPLNPIEYKIPIAFLSKTAVIGSKSKPVDVTTHTWACRTTKLRQVRAACVEAGTSASVFNFLISPFHYYDLPFFGADFVTLPSGHLIALDLQPVLQLDTHHTQLVWERLREFYEKWKSFLPHGGDIPEEARKFFSPCFLWTRIPLGVEGDQLIEDVIRPAFRDYLELYLDLVNHANAVNHDRAFELLSGQSLYIKYRAYKDPARAMLTRFYGREWTEAYIHDVLFDLKS